MRQLSVPVFWRQQKNRYRLFGYKCRKCAYLHSPRRAVCLKCGAGDFDELQLSGRGNLLSWTVIRAAPEGFNKPYTVGLIELEEGPIVAAQVLETNGKLVPGVWMRAAFRRLFETSDNMIVYGTKFEVVEEGSGRDGKEMVG